MNHTATVSTVVDPVCGMTIDPAHAAGASQYRDATFHFCALSCKAAFDAAPAKYAAPETSSAAACCAPGGHCSTR